MTSRDLTRRQVFKLAGGATLGSLFLPALLAGCSDSGGGPSPAAGGGGGGGGGGGRGAAGIANAPEFPPVSGTCVLTPEQTEGPYYLDVNLLRQDISEGQPGLPFAIRLIVVDTTAGCAPLGGRVVEIWHSSAGGVYSGIANLGTGSQTFLRGGQTTDANGVVEFKTVFPGWYVGRANHIHFKVHLGGNRVLTSQFYFDEAVNEQVFSRPPYNERTGTRVRNTGDAIVQASGPTLQMPVNVGADAAAGVLRIGVGQG